MIAWNNIINTALLGTDKKVLNPSELPAALQEAYEQIDTREGLDKEEKFLQIMSVAFTFRQCGIAPVTKQDVSIKEADQEEKVYCNALALQILTDILDEQSNGLLHWWLQHCEARQQIVLPELIPALFGIAVSHKKLRILIATCCGKRGEWLSRFNSDWNFYVVENKEDNWQNGTTEQRKKVLQTLRKTAPAVARDWLQQTWQAENANTKAELLKPLVTNLSEEDADWLETLLEEKSQKVKEVAIDLLKQIPSSSIVKLYWAILQQSITLKKEKSLLGMLSKTSLQIQATGVDDSIFKTGIEKLSATKEYSDDEFILFQLVQFVPPKNWETHFTNTPEGVISLFQKESSTKKFLPALAKAAARFTDINWANALLQKEEFYSDLISVLPEPEQDKYSIQYFDKEPFTIVQLAKERETEWSFALTKKIFKHTAKNAYHYNRNFYNECIHLIPAPIVGELEKCTPQEEYLRMMWSTMSEYITKLITLKLQTIQAFQS